jgi:hypothetical protein
MGPSTGYQAEYERGSERLFETVTAACASRVEFGGRVRSGLDAALAFLGSEPELARLLVLEPYLDRTLLDLHRPLLDRYADLLRRAASSAPEALSHPPFVEVTLLGGIRWQISERLLAGQPTQLPQLAPALTRYVLCYYLQPDRASRDTATSV